MVQALPQNPSPSLVGNAERNAYQRCRDFEAVASSQPKPGQPGVTELVAARILGYMLLCSPSSEGTAVMASEINSCINNTQLHELGNRFKDFVIRCFQSSQGDIISSPLPSPPSFDVRGEDIAALLEEPSKNHSEAKTLALIRDRGRCVLRNNLVDVEWRGFRNPNEPLQPDEELIHTECAHIFAGSTTGNLDDRDKRNYAAKVLTMFERYDGVKFEPLVNGEGVHDLTNVMTMSLDAHRYFDELEIYLEATGEDDTYRVLAHNEEDLRGYPAQVTLKSVDHVVDGKTVTFPKPDPKLLSLHAACARVSHMSGAASYIEKVLRDMEETLVLASDGGSADLLSNALMRRVGSLVLTH